MQTITINAENWVDGEIQLNLDSEAKTFSIHDYEFILVESQMEDDFESYDIFHVENGKQSEFRTGWVCRENFLGKGFGDWEAIQDEMMSRRGETAIIAAAKLVANLY